MHALGWDVSDAWAGDTDEYKVSGGWADYNAATTRQAGQPPPWKPRNWARRWSPTVCRCINYRRMRRVLASAGLTDGNHWELYWRLQAWSSGGAKNGYWRYPSPTIRPAKTDALKLLLLWNRPNLESGQEPVLGPRYPILFEDRQPGGRYSMEPPQPSGFWLALSEYSPPAVTPCPATIRFWDGEHHPLRYWNEVLTLAVKKLYTEGRLTVDDTPIQWSQKAYSVHTEPVHPTGLPFVSHKKISGTPLFVNVHLNAGQVRQNTKKLLQHCGQNPTDVYLQAAK